MGYMAEINGKIIVEFEEEGKKLLTELLEELKKFNSQTATEKQITINAAEIKLDTKKIAKEVAEKLRVKGFNML